mmetsp:Transcript_18944/g.27752  ORF Transcript_18944/g.27752 Transcript_18944/m.27752 type:complete len:641 (-) Transcript_18944:205-2127(-)
MRVCLALWLSVVGVSNAFTTVHRNPLTGVRPFGTPSIFHPRCTSLSSSSSTPTEEEEEETRKVEIPSNWAQQILYELTQVRDPDLEKDIVSLGFIKNLSVDTNTADVSFEVELTSPIHPTKDQLQTDCTNLIAALPWTSQNIKVTMTSPPPLSSTGDIQGMARVNSVIAVSSCKGGVGKSTTAVNLAYALQSLGARVGIFDADIYGPSLPTMVTPDDDAVRFIGRQIQPLQRNNVQLMSFGYVNEGSAVMRGPMVSQLLDQFLSLTYWGEIDYLILDMPPGTGDIQLTLSQRLSIDAAVIVTTPQELSFVDVERGIEMFDSVNVPCVAVVENMAYYDANDKKEEEKTDDKDDDDDLEEHFKELQNAFVTKLQNENVSTNDDSKSLEDIAQQLINLVRESPSIQSSSSSSSTSSSSSSRIDIFGPGHKQRLSNQYGIETTYSIPLASNIASQGDSGTPYILQYPNTPTSASYFDLAKTVAREVGKIKYEQKNGIAAGRLNVVYEEGEHVLRIMQGLSNSSPEDTKDDDEEESSNKSKASTLSPAELRRECKCAACVEELTGKQILIKTTIPDSVRPLKMEPYGNYALSVDWSDGHRSLYPYRQIQGILDEQKEKVAEEDEEKSGSEQEVKQEEVTTVTTAN